MRIHHKRVHHKRTVHGGKLYTSSPMDSDKIQKLTSLMNGFYKKEQGFPSQKKLTGKTFVL